MFLIRQGAVALALVAALASASPARSSGPTRGATAPLPPRYRVALQGADSVFRSSRSTAALAQVDSMVRDARTRGDRGSLAILLRIRGTMDTRIGRSRAAEAPLREALAISESRRDTAVLVQALRFLGVALAQQGRDAEAEAAYRRLLSVARARGDRRSEGYGHHGLAYQSWLAGDLAAARRGYEAAIALHHESGDAASEADATTGLGNALSHLGEFDRARDCYRRVAAMARESGNRWNESHAWNNLGTLEFSLGDPGAAARDFRRALELARESGDLRETTTPALNLAIAHNHLGQRNDARAILDEALRTCEREGYRAEEARLRIELGNLHALEGRSRAAIATFRHALTAADSLPPFTRAEAVLGLTSALESADSAGAALAALEGALPELRRRVRALSACRLEVRRARLLLTLGRTVAALEAARDAADSAEALGLNEPLLNARVLAARALAGLSARDSALSELGRAARLWEAVRSVPIDPEWRAARGTAGREVFARMALLMLDPNAGGTEGDRAGRAFDAVQAWKARALLERMRGPGASPGAAPGTGVQAVTVAELQARVLRPGELLLDAVVGPDSSLLLAITRDSARAIGLPGERRLRERLAPLRELVSRPPSGGADAARNEVLERATAALGTGLLDWIRPWLSASRRVIVCADGPLHLLPFALLRSGAPGAHPSGPLLESREVVAVPSTALLASFRRRDPGDGAAASGRVLALAGRRREDGTPLPGAAREVRALRAGYRDVSLLEDGALDAAAFEREARAAGAAIHFAAHTVADDQHPWRSGVLLGTPDSARRDPWLRAGRIAAMRLDARLAVLSGCETGAGRVLSGEGVQSLAAAFLIAGVPAVIATLWAVDDRTTADLMGCFYRELARGESPAAALRHAQLEIRSRRATRDPFFWAGFVLIGDGDVRVPIARRFPAGALATLAGAGVAGGGLLWWRRRRGGVRPGAAASTL